MILMGEDEDQSKPYGDGPDNLTKADAANSDNNRLADALQHATNKRAWRQLWGLRAAWCVTVFGLIGLIAVTSKWVLTEREAARALNLDMLAINSRATFPEPRVRVTTQALAGASEVPAENKAAPELVMPSSAPALPAATSVPQKTVREIVHEKPSAPASRLGKVLAKKAAITRKALKKARGSDLAKSQSKRTLGAGPAPNPTSHVALMSRARTQRLQAALRQYRMMNGKKVLQCGARTRHARKNCDRVPPSSGR